MKKQIFLISFLLCTVVNLFAQKNKNIYYLKGTRIVENADSADYMRIIEEPDSGSTLYKLTEIYKNNTKKTIGFVTAFEPRLKYEGLLLRFNKTGKVISRENYKNGNLTGYFTHYYSNGKPHQVRFAEELLVNSGKNIDAFRLVHYYDSTGVQLVKDGNGIFKDEKAVYTQGEYLNGKKNGVWEGKYEGNAFEETFKDGQFVSGVATLLNGKKTKYTSIYTPPAYPGSIDGFYRYLNTKIIYPKEATAAHVMGIINISFVIEKNGMISKIKILNDLGYGTSQACINALEASQAWYPATLHGVPQQSLNIRLPIKFNAN